MKYLYIFLLSLFQTSVSAQEVFKNYDINPGADSSHPYGFTTYNGSMYFAASTSAYGSELWRIDNNNNMQMIADINQGTGDAYPVILGEVNGKLIFAATDTTHGMELWATDGTATGTSLLMDIYPGKQSGIYISSSIYDPGLTCVYNGKLYFCAVTPTDGNELWATDGTTAGTNLVADINPGTGNSYPSYFSTINGKLIFWANDGTHHNEPWISDGTPAGTMLLKDISPTGTSLYYEAFLTLNGLYYFWASTGGINSKVNVWVTDGTVTGTRQLKSSSNGSGSFISKFVAYKDKVYFWNSQDTGYGPQLWVTDGTDPGTHVFSNAAPNTVLHFTRDFLVFKDKLYFTGGIYRLDTMSGCELWVTDGTDGGTKLVADLGGQYSSTPYWLTSQGNYLYFLAQDTNDYKLYRTDGTTTGTHMIAPANATFQNALTRTMEGGKLYAYNNKIWMNAAFTNTGLELWSVEDMFPQSIHTATNNSTDIILYPNPAHHNFTIKTTTTFTNGSVTLTDVTGKVVLSQPLIPNSQSRISLQGIAPGIYIADIWLDDKRNTQRLIVQ